MRVGDRACTSPIENRDCTHLAIGFEVLQGEGAYDVEYVASEPLELIKVFLPSGSDLMLREVIVKDCVIARDIAVSAFNLILDDAACLPAVSLVPFSVTLSTCDRMCFRFERPTATTRGNWFFRRRQA